ncbi:MULTISPECIES: SURF1 family protein [unclassified Arthrobacter]|uniref:SURF1 family cytochrome oxidase biogenesis protein n=1 Tax=unclassified Arthrobacter TaxID=235627 RepID=UPI001E53F606|nr:MULTISPECIES: SURF1 family protein [unclassified Arthrobacter]MCC9145392.1 SURF1 family protein [Arthrobacter sp. zg-Y919]MDK1276620.1 SURF1 family protein [Arthrobacter sp. zg.Y919]WIB04430.1 SURF1 family protein [Arthrobacter sp. zg-Y919]
MYRFLFSARWLGWFVLVCVLAAACVSLGLWQMDRREASLADTARIENNYDADPVPYTEAEQYFDTYDEGAEWLPVRLEGTYDSESQRIVRNRPLKGRPGYEVLVPLKLDDGSSVAVNRGWLPIGDDEAGRPDSIPAAPEGRVTVVGRIKAAEPTLARTAPEGQLPSIDLGAFAKQLDYPLHQGAYALMSSEDPRADVVPETAPRPEVDEGLHLSYGLQWYGFALMMFLGLGYAARQEALNRYYDGIEDEDDELDDDEVIAAHPAPSRRRPPRRKKRGPTGEEEEDAILDAQGF